MYNNKDRKLKTGSDIIKKLNIVLYTPEIPQNTGNISRTCAVTGAALHIIRPTGFEISDRTLKRAGLDYWDKLEVFYYDSYADFLDKVGPDAPLFFFSSKGKRCYTEAEYPDNSFRSYLRFAALENMHKNSPTYDGSPFTYDFYSPYLQK